uniref:Uncharacterized protein n=1 Tax=Oryza brachyantha TaxID=4533 RepID=J3MVX1_ORYBR
MILLVLQFIPENNMHVLVLAVHLGIIQHSESSGEFVCIYLSNLTYVSSKKTKYH